LGRINPGSVKAGSMLALLQALEDAAACREKACGNHVENPERASAYREAAERIKQTTYMQVALHLRQKISDGVYPVGSRLPNQPQMMGMFDVSLNTVQKALHILRTDGLITTRRYLGSTVIKQ
jgi:hypothetical protein